MELQKFIFFSFYFILTVFEADCSECKWYNWFIGNCKTDIDCIDFNTSKKKYYRSIDKISGELMHIICYCKETEIEIKNQKFKWIEDNSFKQCPKLLRISFYGNNIKHIPDNVFKGLYALKKLELGGNELTSIKIPWFTDLNMLEELHLQENHIQVVPEKILLEVPTLKKLILTSNEIKTFNVERIEQLNLLYLTKNQLSCKDLNILKTKLKKNNKIAEFDNLDCHVLNMPSSIETTQIPMQNFSSKKIEIHQRNKASCKCSATFVIIAGVVTGINGLILIVLIFKYKITAITF